MDLKQTLTKPKVFIPAIVLLVAISALVSGFTTPVVKSGEVVFINYTGSFTNGTVFGSNAGQKPLNFTVGANQVIPGFEQAILGMKLGQQKSFTLAPAQAYGNANPSLVESIPSNAFKNKSVSIGMGVGQLINGQQAEGFVTAINATNITLNFNPPLAGKTLVFKIQVVGIK